MSDNAMREHAQALIAQGMTKEDSAVAIHLAWIIRVLDRHVFPASPAEVHCLSQVHPNGFVAGYDDTSADPERYLVYVQGLHQIFREDCLATRFLDGYGPGTLFPSLLERITSVAVHEVRHRLQRLYGEHLRMWTPHTRSAGLMAGVIAQAREELLPRILQAKVQRRRVLAAHLKEFDALVVEYHALHRIHAIDRPEDLVPLVWIEP